MPSERQIQRALERAERVIERAKVAKWAEQAVGWVNAHGDADDQDALARWLAALLRERAMSLMLDETVSDESLLGRARAEHGRGLDRA